MKKNFSILFLLSMMPMLIFFIVPSFAQTTPVQGSFSDLTLEISSPKQKLVQFEPMALILTLSNKTSSPIAARTSIDLSAGFVELFTIRKNGEPVKIQNLSPIAGLVIVRPGIIRSGESHQTKELLTLDLDKVFPQPGTYQIQAVLRNGEGKQQVKSNLLTIHVLEPTGLDIQAFDYLKNRTNPSYFFSGLELDKTQVQMVEFVSNFRDSSYGDYVAFMLGEFYLVRKDYTRAIEQLNGVSKKPDFVYGDRALYYLVEGNARLGNWQQAGHHLDSLRASHPDSNYLERAEISMSRETKTR